MFIVIGTSTVIEDRPIRKGNTKNISAKPHGVWMPIEVLVPKIMKTFVPKKVLRGLACQKKGKLSKKQKTKEKQSAFKRLQRWLAGVEAMISLLKRKYGIDRSRFRGYYSV